MDLLRTENGHWWARAAISGYLEDATNHHILTTHIYMHRGSGRAQGGALDQAP